MNRTYEEWLKYYENVTKEQVIEDLTRDIQYFSDACKDLEELQNKYYELKKQKEDVVEYIKSFYESPEYIDAYDITYWTNEVLRMLGEIDE